MGEGIATSLGPEKRYDTVVTTIITSIVGAIIGVIMALVIKK